MIGMRGHFPSYHEGRGGFTRFESEITIIMKPRFFTTKSIEMKEFLVEEYSNSRRGVMGTVVGDRPILGDSLWSTHGSYLEGVSKQVRSYPFHSLTTYSIKVNSLAVCFGRWNQLWVN